MIGTGAVLSLINKIGRIFRKAGKKWGWKFWAAIAALILAIPLSLGIWYVMHQIAVERQAKIQAQTDLATEKENGERLEVAYKNQGKELQRLKDSQKEEKCHALTIEDRFPDGRVRITTTEICESTTRTISHEAESSHVDLPPLATPRELPLPALTSPHRPWELGLEYWPKQTACQADLSYRIGRWGIGAGIQPDPFGWGVRGSVAF